MSFSDKSSRPSYGLTSQNGDTSRDSDTANKQVVHSALTGVVPQPEDDETIQGQTAKEDLRKSERIEDSLVPAGSQRHRLYQLLIRSQEGRKLLMNQLQICPLI